jgi:hydrogenase-4 component F
MFLVVLANNLGVMWFALEATALSSVLLVALVQPPPPSKPPGNTSSSAAWAWRWRCSARCSLYAAAMTRSLHGAAQLQLVAPDDRGRTARPGMIKLAFVFVLIGYGTKAGLAPMHTWLPDAHSEAPSPTSAMLSGVSLKVALYALLRFHILTTACLGTALQPDDAAGASGWGPCSWPRRSSWCRPISSGCWPIRASSTSA